MSREFGAHASENVGMYILDYIGVLVSDNEIFMLESNHVCDAGAQPRITASGLVA
jgi:hypothetical protein